MRCVHALGSSTHENLSRSLTESLGHACQCATVFTDHIKTLLFLASACISGLNPIMNTIAIEYFASRSTMGISTAIPYKSSEEDGLTSVEEHVSPSDKTTGPHVLTVSLCSERYEANSSGPYKVHTKNHEVYHTPAQS